jgi:hypothetical protein
MNAFRLASSLFVVALLSTSVRADEELIALDKLPKAVLEAVKKRFPKAELLEAAKETDKDKTEYEITLKEAGVKIDVMLTPDGKITLIEKMIAAKDLPKAVTDALEAKYPKATYKTVEELTKVTAGKEAVDAYEVLLVTADKKTYEVLLGTDGKIQETEEKKDGAQDDKDEKKVEKKKDKK